MADLPSVLRRAAPFFSFIIGLGLAAILFHRKYDSILTLAMPLKDTLGRTVKVDGKCYKYRVEDARCETSQ